MTAMRWGARVGWALLAIAALELVAREVARLSILSEIFGLNFSVWTMVAVGSVGAGIAAAVEAGFSRPSSGPETGRLKPASTVPFAPLLFAVLFIIGVALQLHLGARLQSDGFYYYAYLRSIAFDRDVNFTNDYKLLGLGDKPHLFNPTPTGYAQSAWTIGPAVVWAPFFAVAHPIAVSRGTRNPNIHANGTSFPYRQAVCIAGLFYGLLGCWFSWRFVALYFDRRLAAAATAFVVAGSFMLWYMVKEPSMTHAPSMAGAAAFMWMWAATRDSRTPRQWALLGALAGFIALIRWQNALLAILPACDAVIALAGAYRRNDKERIRATLLAGLVFTACATVAFLPQMLAWRAIYGSYLAVSPIGPQIRWWNPHLVDILWSSRNGLLSWSPVLYVGAVGLIVFTWVRPAIAISALLFLTVMIYFNASIQDWWGSAGFGGRRFDGTIPLFALGAAALGQQAVHWTARHPSKVVMAAGALIVLWNVTLVKVAQDGHVRIGESMSFGETGAHQARAFHGWFGHPFTYPASVIFALRNGLSVGAYDLLSANRFLGDPARPYGRIDIGSGDEPLVREGWHAPEKEGNVTFRWASNPATLLVPLDHAAHLRMQIRLHAFSYPAAFPQTMNAYVNDALVGSGFAVPGEWTTIEFVAEDRAWRSGVNRLRLEFSRATRPVDVALGGDSRSLAAAVDFVRVQK